MNKRQIKITIAYDGTNYCGFQMQKNGVSVSEVVDKALSKIAGHPVKIMGVSRTDGGVHAHGQVATFFLTGTIAAARIPRAVSGHLPTDIVISEAEEMPLEFNCRHAASGKHYRYTVRTSQISSPFDHRYVWHYPSRLDIEAMAKAIPLIEGEHDFKAFTGMHSGKEDFVRTVDRITVQRVADDFIFDFWGHGFLYKMVRSIAGYLVDVGRGFLPAEIALTAFETGNRELLGHTAPAKGLNLIKIYYDDKYYIDKDSILR